MKKGRVNAKYEEKYIKANRTFPVGNTIWLVVLVIVQIIAIVFAVVYEPKPQDRIHSYCISVEPREDGSLDIEYAFAWEALDETEPLTWIDIGMANANFTVYPDSVSSNVSSYRKEVEGDYVALRLDLDRAYVGGDMLLLTFKINQKSMLCRDGSGYFYEFIPGWFNATPVDSYEFRWKTGGSLEAENAITEGDYYIWNGSFECGGYEKMFVRYSPDVFTGCNIVDYQPFNDDGAYNELAESKVGVVVIVCILILLLVVAEVYIVDSYVSYHRGRGFITGYGYHVHTYGRSNPWYIKERDKRAAKSSGSRYRGGGGCACACACACAGGGRAGCSQKDTYGNSSGDIDPLRDLRYMP